MAEEEIIEEGTPGVDALIWQIADRRWREECRGVSYLGIRWGGDRDSRQSVVETIRAAEEYEVANGDGSFSTTWKGLYGWVTGVTLADLREVLTLLASRRQACFEIERQKVADAEAGNAVDLGAGWPG